jgi:CRP-like cAMP-binding protein
MINSVNGLYDCNSCIFRNLSCTLIPADDFEIIRCTSVQLKFSKGETVLKQGGRASNLVFLHKGIVKFSYHYDSGENYIMTVVSGPKLLGGANLFFKETNIFSLTAVEESEICMIDIKALKSVALKNSNYIFSVFESTVNMFQHSIFNFISLAHNQVNGRIASILIYLWEHVYKNSGYDFTISRKEIAEFAACSHENVINTLSRFRKEGIIQLDGKKILIENIAALKELSRKG